MADDQIQHGIDDNPHDDAKKGATLGGVGGAVTGALAGAAGGPVGAVVGAVIGGVAGAIASGAAVAAVDAVDNDNTVSGIGAGPTTDADTGLHHAHIDAPTHGSHISDTQAPGMALGGTADTPGLTGTSAGTGLGSAGAAASGAALGSASGMGMTQGVGLGQTDDLTARTASGEVRVPVVEEVADVDKVRREAGEVAIHKHVESETQHISEPLAHTRVVVETRDVAPGTATAGVAEIHEGEAIRVPVMEEELVVQKVPRVTGEVVVRTEEVSEREERDVTLRRERVEVDEVGEVDLQSSAAVTTNPTGTSNTRGTT